MTEQVTRLQAARLIEDIEQEMRRLGIWGQQMPRAEALASRVPFCYDTLHLWQWLQWVLVPRIRLIVADADPLPGHSDISPLAEVEFRRLDQDTSQLLALIREFDQLLNGTRTPRQH